MKKETCEKKKVFGLCPYVTAQQLLTGKWVILILHSLADGPKRFSVMQKEIAITQATLSSQLKHLQQEGLITRTVYPEVPPRVEYEMTDMGKEFKDVLRAIEIWGRRYIEYLHEHNPHGEAKEDEAE